MNNDNDIIEREIMTAESGSLAILNRSEIDMQIATAHKFPRSIKQFRTDVFNMVTLSEEIAGECIYALPRGGKVVEGPSARFAEIVASAWGNSRAGARVISDQGDFVTAQGVFHDLQKNVAITYEVQRRITDKSNRRFNADMVGMTANAACSIALRNAILKGVPKAFWSEMYEGARKTAMGDVKTLPTRRAEAYESLQRFGISKDQVYAKLNVKGDDDVGLEQLLILKGLVTAMRDGDTTPEQAFSDDGITPSDKAPKRKPIDLKTQTQNDAQSPRAEVGLLTAISNRLAEKNITVDVMLLSGEFGEIESLEGITVAQAEKMMIWIRNAIPTKASDAAE
jgi:hypothetical protein